VSETCTQRLHRGIGGGTHAQGDRRNTGSPERRLGGVPSQPDAREGQAGPFGVAEGPVRPWKPGNSGGGKGPWFKATQDAAKDRRLEMILTPPESVRKLQTALQAKAKGAPNYRFYLLYDKLYRKDVLAYAYQRCKANKGTPGIDEQEFADIEAYGEERWLGELADTLRRKTYRAEAVRRVWIPKVGDSKKLAGDSPDCGPRGHDGGDGGARTDLRRRHAGGATRLQTKLECPHGGVFG